jgi:hypothetical protein
LRVTPFLFSKTDDTIKKFRKIMVYFTTYYKFVS